MMVEPGLNRAMKYSQVEVDLLASRRDTRCCSLYHPTNPPQSADAVICILRAYSQLLGSVVTG